VRGHSAQAPTLGREGESKKKPTFPWGSREILLSDLGRKGNIAHKGRTCASDLIEKEKLLTEKKREKKK